MSLAERLALKSGTALSKPAAKATSSTFNMSSMNAAVQAVAAKPVATKKSAPAKKPAVASKRAPAKKAAAMSDSEEFDDASDSEVSAPVAPRSTARPQRARATKSYAVSESEESEDDFTEDEDDDDDFSDSE